VLSNVVEVEIFNYAIQILLQPTRELSAPQVTVLERKKVGSKSNRSVATYGTFLKPRFCGVAFISFHAAKNLFIHICMMIHTYVHIHICKCMVICNVRPSVSFPKRLQIFSHQKQTFSQMFSAEPKVPSLIFFVQRIKDKLLNYFLSSRIVDKF
jgi:hypothetical protein